MHLYWYDRDDPVKAASDRFKEETTAFTSNQRRHILVLIPAHVRPMKLYNLRIKDFDS